MLHCRDDVVKAPDLVQVKVLIDIPYTCTEIFSLIEMLRIFEIVIVILYIYCISRMFQYPEMSSDHVTY